MKPLFFLSLGLNVVLLAIVGLRLKKETSPSESGEARVQREAKISGEPAPVEAADQDKPITPAPTPVDWRLVESEDYRKYAANLRAIGCPEETIRDIITADVNKLFNERGKNLSKGGKRFEYWKTGNPMAGMMSEERVAEQQQLAREKREMLSSLIGSDVEVAIDVNDSGMIDEMLDFIPGPKRAQALEIEQRFAARLMKSIGGGAADAEDMKEVQKVQKEKEAEMAKLLSPAEKEDYDLRMSQTSMMMRFQLDGFAPSEQEFRDIFGIKKKYEDRLSPFWNPSSAGENEKRAAAQKEQDAEMLALLGENRFAEFQREQDFAYKGIAKVATRQGLAKEAAIQVFDMKKEVESRTAALRAANAQLNPEQREESLRNLRTDTENRIVGILGKEGLQSLLNNPAAAHWLTSLPSAQK